jgi:hypothetical protein
MMQQHFRYSGYGVECPFCRKRIKAYFTAQEFESVIPELHHDPDPCREFWEKRDDDAFLVDLRQRMRPWPDEDVE